MNERTSGMAHEADASILSWIMELALKALGAAAMGLLAAWTWFNKQIAHVDGKVELLEADTVKRMGYLDNRISEHATRLAVGEKDFENLRAQLDEVIDGQKEMTKKQDRVLEMLIDLRGGRHERS